MIQNLNIRVGPQYYRYGEGAIDIIPDILQEYQAKKIMIVHGTISWKKAKPYLKKLLEFENNIIFEQYRGECSYNEGQRISEIIKKKGIDFVIGVGGGKLADLVYYACHLTNTPFGIVPTLASNCAAWAPLSVMYKDNGLAEGKTEHYNRQASFLITDPSLVIDAPLNYFIAGIADTLAKWYESDLILEQEKYRSEPFPQLARFASQICKDTILNESMKAIEDMKKKEISPEFYHVSEIIFGIAGLVGGFGDKYARNTAAHAMHDAISKFLPEVHKYLHGEKVAYGILYQLSIEGKWQEIDKLIPLYEKLNLPKSLTDMGVYPMSDDLLQQIIQFVNSTEKVHLLPLEINENVLKKALVDLEDYMNK